MLVRSLPCVHFSHVFCKKHPEIARHFLSAHAAIFTSAATTTLGCCWPHTSAADADATTSTSASASGGSRQPTVRTVQPADAAAAVFNTDRPKSITALVVDRSHGMTVKQRIKQKGFANARYVAAVLVQMVPVLATLQAELGFNHDDLRLDNLLEWWPSNSKADQPQVDSPDSKSASSASQVHSVHTSNHTSSSTGPGPATASGGSSCDAFRTRGAAAAVLHPSGSSGGTGSNGSSGSSSDWTMQLPGVPTFILFDFGLSMINPDRFSIGRQAQASAAEKRQALARLREQGELEGVGMLPASACLDKLPA